jgi:hypothetical protein
MNVSIIPIAFRVLCRPVPALSGIQSPNRVKPKRLDTPRRAHAVAPIARHAATHDARDRATMHDDDDARGVVIGRRKRQDIRRSRRPIERPKGAQAHGRSVARISRTRDAYGFSGRVRRECEDARVD